MKKRVRNILTISVSVTVALLTLGLIITLILFKSGSLDQNQLMAICFFLTGTLTSVIVLFGAILISVNESEERYAEFIKNQHDE